MTTKTAPANTTRCRSCHRPLRAAKSVAQGRGKVCQAKYEARITATVTAETTTPAQADKAIELITDQGIAKVIGSLYLAVSSDGSTRYEVDAVTGTCSCKAGQHGRACYHLASARALHAA